MGRDQHRLSATTTCSSLPKLIAEKSIPDPSGAGQVVQSWAAPLVVRNGGSGGAGYEVQTAGNAGSEPLIFVPRAARSVTRGS